MQNKKIPLRMCLGCNEQKEKRQLIRVVKTKDNEIFLDDTGKKAGRGAYICPKSDCLKTARKKGRIDKSLGIKIPDEIYDKLEEEIKKIEE